MSPIYEVGCNVFEFFDTIIKHVVSVFTKINMKQLQHNKNTIQLHELSLYNVIKCSVRVRLCDQN